MRVLGDWLGINGVGVYGTRPWWDARAEGWLIGSSRIPVRAVRKEGKEGVYELYFGMLGELEEGKARLEGYPELAELLKKDKGVDAVLLVSGGRSSRPIDAKPSTLPLQYSIDGDAVILNLPAGASAKVAVDVPIANPGDTTGKDNVEPDRMVRQVLAWTVRFGSFRTEVAKL